MLRSVKRYVFSEKRALAALPSPRVSEGRQINIELWFTETSGRDITTGVGNLL